MAAGCRVWAHCVCAKWTEECSLLASLGAVHVPRLGTAPLGHQSDGARQALGNVCVVVGLFWDSGFSCGALCKRDPFAFCVCQHISALSASVPRLFLAVFWDRNFCLV